MLIIIIAVTVSPSLAMSTDLSEPAERLRQLEADNARLSDKLAAMSDRSSRLIRDATDFRSFLSRDVVSPGRTQRLEDDCRNLQRKVLLISTSFLVRNLPKKPKIQIKTLACGSLK